MHIGAPSDAGRHIVDVEVEILVHAGLQAEGTNDSRAVMLLRCRYIFFRQLKGLLQERLSQGGRVVAAYGVFRIDLQVV